MEKNNGRHPFADGAGRLSPYDFWNYAAKSFILQRLIILFVFVLLVLLPLFLGLLLLAFRLFPVLFFLIAAFAVELLLVRRRAVIMNFLKMIARVGCRRSIAARIRWSIVMRIWRSVAA